MSIGGTTLKSPESTADLRIVLKVGIVRSFSSVLVEFEDNSIDPEESSLNREG
jgi:hypothetical protein